MLYIILIIYSVFHFFYTPLGSVPYIVYFHPSACWRTITQCDILRCNVYYNISLLSYIKIIIAFVEIKYEKMTKNYDC